MTSVSLAMALGAWAASTKELTVVPWPDKVLYEPGETARFVITVNNDSTEAVQGLLRVEVLWEMEDSDSVAEQGLALAPGERREMALSWKTKEVLGCEVRAQLLKDGRVVATNGEYFNVCRSKDMQRIGIHVEYPNLDTFSSPEYLATIPEKVRALRAAYGNLVEHLSPLPDSFALLAPKEEEWVGGYWNSKSALLKAIAEEHRYGMRSVHYATGYTQAREGAELIRRHPEWFVFRASGQPYFGGTFDVLLLDRARRPMRKESIECSAMGAPANFTRKEPLEFGIDQLIASKRMFGWDGVRFDGHYCVWTLDAHDIFGKPAPPPKVAQEITRKNTVYTKRKVHSVFPDYLFMFNTEIRSASTGELNPDVEAQCADGGASANESVRETFLTTSQWHTWKAFSDLLVADADACRPLGGYAYAYCNPPWCVNPAVDVIQYSMLLAAGNHPWFSMPALDRKADVGGSHYPIQKSLFAFATRFSAMLWGPGIERIKDPSLVVEVSSQEGAIWWRDYVFRRKLSGGRVYVTVHLVVKPPTETIEAAAQTVPDPVEAVGVRFKEKVRRAWIAYPRPKLSYSAADVKEGILAVPKVDVWAMVVAELAR